MPKPTLNQPYFKLEHDLIEALLKGHHRWRPDLNFPESWSDMQGAVREIMALYTITEKPRPANDEEIRQRILNMWSPRIKDVNNSPVPIEDLSDCKHERTISLQSSRYSGEHDTERQHVDFCVNCGNFSIHGQQGREFYSFSFHVNHPDVLGAMQRWMDFVDRNV